MKIYKTYPWYYNKQITFDDIMNDHQIYNNSHASTKTILVDSNDYHVKSFNNLYVVRSRLQQMCEKYQSLIDTEDKKSLYHSFKIPKRSGGYRQIDAPQDELMDALRDFKGVCEKLISDKCHASAYAYVKNRSVTDVAVEHQANCSKWFLKIDFSDFFGSTNYEFVVRQLEKIYPYNVVLSDEPSRESFLKMLSLCFLDGKLPQGTPMSPLLTNLVMIPIDYHISKTMSSCKPYMRYTRYADDIQISSRVNFQYKPVIEKIREILKEEEAPYIIKDKKTRYGSSAGANWMLGVMLNQNNEITIGYKKKKVFKATVFNFMNDFTKDVKWSLGDVQTLLGNISWYRSVEKEAIDEILKKYSEKFGKDVEECLKSIIRG